ELGRELAVEREAAALLTKEGDDARARLAAKTADLDELQFRTREKELEQEGLRQRVLALLGEASTLRNQLAQIEEFLAGLERQSTPARPEETAAVQEADQLSLERRILLDRLREQQLDLESLDERRQRLESTLAETQQQAQQHRDRLASLKDETARCEARRESLEEILSHRAYTTETVKNLFAAIEQGRMGAFRAKGILADFIDVDSQYEKIIDDFLREELEYVVVENWKQAEEGLRLLRAEMEGHATFLVEPEPDRALDALVVGPETGVIERL